MNNVKILENKKLIDIKDEEYYNLIRTNIQFSGDNIKSIMVTSGQKNEGKSTLSINIALSFAKNENLKVLYLDCDMRKSTFASRVKFDSKPQGLTMYLTGMASLEEIVYNTELPNFKVIPSGHIAPNANSLINSNKFNNMMKQLESVFDIIIVDTPPVGVVSDPLIISKLCDATMLVVQSKKYKKNQIQKHIDDLMKINEHFIGVVLNKVEFNKSSYGSYGNYGNYGNY